MAVHISAVHGSSIASAKDTALALIVNSNIMTDILNKTFLKCDECTEEFEYLTELKQHKKIQHISLEELGIPKLPESLPRMKQNVSLESDESGYDYDPDSDSETDEASLREKLLVQDQEVECEKCDSTFRFQSGLRAHVKLFHSGGALNALIRMRTKTN